MGIGFTDIGACGALVTFQFWINDSDDNFFLALLMSITSFLWILSCVVGIYMVKLAHFDLGQFLAQKYAPMAVEAAKEQARIEAQNQLAQGTQGSLNSGQNSGAWR